jgi:hypothetical protein
VAGAGAGDALAAAEAGVVQVAAAVTWLPAVWAAVYAWVLAAGGLAAFVFLAAFSLAWCRGRIPPAGEEE